MKLGVCYYPEHWPEPWWADDARRMAEIGLSRVRIGEFAWSRMEPDPGRLEWGWLDRAVETLHAAGLGVIMGTPTATPPKWLVDQHPDMLALDWHGHPRKFGSRRHYCFSSEAYSAQAARIVSLLAERYGKHPAIVAWQTDNEYGCHDTTISYSPSALRAFRLWLATKYGDVAALNQAWGNVFWSMEYRSFEEIDLPHLTVTGRNPAHELDFKRFSSDQVVRFNRMQADILRAHSSGRDITHNFMGFYTEFDHHAVGAHLDVASWDSYPLGFLEQFWFSDEEKRAFARQGHPDIAGFHHDLYRGCQKQGRWWVMEQQPGPVNWANYNPAPLSGMVRLWTLEAMAHGAELVSYFRWRQAPFAQEQMHTGLLRPDSVEDVGAHEARAAAVDIAAIGAIGAPPKSIALLFDYCADWVTQIQPQGRGFSALRLAFEFYTALRRRGLDVDIISPEADLTGYQLVAIPCLPIIDQGLIDRLGAFEGSILIGPRTASKTENFSIHDALPPGPLQSLLPVKVVRVETLRDGLWLEHVETECEAEFDHCYRYGKIRYIAKWPEPELLDQLIARILPDTILFPQTLRIRRAGDHVFAFNCGAEPVTLPYPPKHFILGCETLPPAGVSVWKKRA